MKEVGVKFEARRLGFMCALVEIPVFMAVVLMVLGMVPGGLLGAILLMFVSGGILATMVWRTLRFMKCRQCGRVLQVASSREFTCETCGVNYVRDPVKSFIQSGL